MPHESLRPAVAPGALALACVALGAALLAQGSGATIVGVAKDSAGSVLPGVTVVVTSPALGQRVRGIVTDGTGQYRIVALPSGTYTLTAGLTGFNTFERTGLEVSGTGIVTVNVELSVIGVLGMMVPAGGDRPAVGQTTTRERVMSREVVDALPPRLLESSQFCQSLFAATYFLDRTQAIEGDLRRIMFRDGQTFMHIAVQDQAGVVQLWSARWGRSALSNRPASFLRPGDRVIVAGHPGRNVEAHRLLLLTLTLPNHGWKWGISSVGTGTCEIQLGVLVPGVSSVR